MPALALLQDKVEEAYTAVRVSEHYGVGKGLTADCAAVAIYLVLSQHLKDVMVV